MYDKIIIAVLILRLSPFSNALFFGLFSSKPASDPDVIVTEPTESEADNLAYENYLRSLASTYSSNPPVQYVPVYVVQPQYSYTRYVEPKRHYIHPSAAVQPIQQAPAATRVEYTHPQYTPSVQFQKPITVLPSSSYQHAAENLNKLIEAPVSSAITKVKSIDYEMPEPQMSTTLYDLPITGIAPDFRTGGYLTKTISPPLDNNKRSGRRFGHSYTHGDGTKVSEEGQLVQLQNGQETVVKRGQYEYIDAAGKPVLVKWIADDNGFRLVN